MIARLQSKEGGKDQESIQSSTTPDPEYHMEKCINTNKHHKQEPRGQHFPTKQQWTDAKAWQTQNINNTNDPQKKYRLGTVIKIVFWRA